MSRSTPSADTARTLILVGLILDVILEVILLAVGLFLLIAPVLGGVILGFALIGLVWVFLIYVFSYQRVREGDYEGARTPTLVFAILSLLSFALIPGILFLIAYVKLGDATREAPGPSVAWGTAPAAPLRSAAPAGGGTSCAHCGRSNPAGGRFCQGCGAPLG